MERYEYSFSAPVGQEELKTTLLLDLVEPRLDGMLIQGEKGTAKSTAVRGLAELMDEVEMMEECPFHCQMDGEALRDEYRSSPAHRAIPYHRRVVELPANATEDRVVGTLDLGRMLEEGVRAFEPDLLAQANGNIFYAGKTNLLKDHIMDVLLDSATMGVNTVERERISYSHPACFVLVGTMNPEEEGLRSQLLGRFGLMVETHGEQETKTRKEVVRRHLAFKKNPAAFYAHWTPEQETLQHRIGSVQVLLPQVSLSKPLFDIMARVYTTPQIDDHWADVAMLKTARALAALKGRTEAGMEELRWAAELALPHRLRRVPFEQAGDADVDWEALFYG